MRSAERTTGAKSITEIPFGVAVVVRATPMHLGRPCLPGDSLNGGNRPREGIVREAHFAFARVTIEEAVRAAANNRLDTRGLESGRC
jgi:hypothetical protein